MSQWDLYPAQYRSSEMRWLLANIHSGESCAVLGLSGSGKSNLLGFFTHRIQDAALRFALVDLNRTPTRDSNNLIRLMQVSLIQLTGSPPITSPPASTAEELLTLETLLSNYLNTHASLCILIDRFELLADDEHRNILSNLRALRDAHKYHLTYILATRRPLKLTSELAELFYANTIWLGPLSENDARWSVMAFAQRKGLSWEKHIADRLIEITWGYPSFLRAACEAYASGVNMESEALLQHPAIQLRLAEFWEDKPSNQDLENSRLMGHPFLTTGKSTTLTTVIHPTPAELTAKEYLLLQYFQSHPNQVCSKDELVRAIWPEDKVFLEGVRDDSLTQLIRRLRKKIEQNTSNPTHIHTISGRGYRFRH